MAIKTSKTQNINVLDAIERWRKQPRYFVTECIGAAPSNQQEEGLTLIGEICQAKLKRSMSQKMTPAEMELSQKMGISIRSGHGTGKDCFTAWMLWWLMACFGNSKESPRGRATAPTAPQLKSILWSELKKWMRQSPLLTELMDWQTERIFYKQRKEEWFVEARTANIQGTSDEQGEALAGLHAPWMMLVVDEASGCPDGVFKPLEGAMTGMMNFALLIGNPTRSSGYFFDTFGKYKDLWVTLHWDCEKSNLDAVLNNHAVADYCARMAKKYGRDSNIYRIRVRGDFPISESNVLIPYEWVLSAVNREIVPLEDAPRLTGIDVGGGGDKSVMLNRHGKKILSIKEYDDSDTMKVTGWVARELGIDDDYNMAFIDPIGIGAGVHDRLVEMGVPNVEAVDVRRKADDDSRFFSVRDELAWKVRDDFEKGIISIPDDEELIGELTTIRVDDSKLDSKGLIKVESKKEMRKRGLDSPNKFDALALTYYMDDETYRKASPTAKRKVRKVESWKVL